MEQSLQVLLYIASIAVIVISVLFLSLLIYLIILLRSLKMTLDNIVDRFKRSADGISRFWGLFKTTKSRRKKEE